VNAANSYKIDFERGMSSAPVIAIGVIVLNAVVFFATISLGFLQSESAILSVGALSRELVLEGEVWRLFSAMFLHGSLEHLFGNAVGLFILGIAAEHAYGRLETAGIYVIAGLAGSVLSVLVNPGPSVGASGAIFGLLGAMIVFFLQYHDRFHLRDRRIGNVLILWAGYSVVTAFFIPFIDNAAHVGGLIGGAFAGYWLSPGLIKSMVESSNGKTHATARRA
jgi:rhomboid protease GluP